MSRHLEHGTSAGVRKSPPPRVINSNKAIEELAPISMETLRKDQGRLREDSDAWIYLEETGFNPSALKERFGVGLAALSKIKEDRASGHWLEAPVVGRDGTLLKRKVKLTVPGFTENPHHPDSWTAGASLTYWCGAAEKKTWLFVAPRIRDAWRIWSAVRGTSLDGRMAIIAPTVSEEIPYEWKTFEFWHGWDRVYLGHDNDAAGEQMAARIRQPKAGRDFLRIEAPRTTGRSWLDFFTGQDPGPKVLEAFEARMEEAHALSAKSPAAAPNVPLKHQEDNIYEDRRININGAYHAGHMYYPFQVRRVKTMQRREDRGDGSFKMVPYKTSFYQTRVVRSDGVTLDIQVAPAPRGVEEEDRAIMLDDGTEILAIPRPREFSTWKWPNISQFVKDMEAGDDPHRPLPEIVANLRSYMRKVSWLPNETDYDLIAAYVVVSYCYNAFDAIPMILLNGEKGSGKSSLAEAIADLSFNGQMLGGGSEKAFIRAVNQGRGLLVLDDLESVGRRGNRDGGYGDINQILKVSYSKATGVKSVVDQNGVSRTLYFYSPKVITNIQGIDAVNATRMYQILCRPMPQDIAVSGRIRGADAAISEPLRQELHAWGMANIHDAHMRYREKAASRSGRAEQIAAPLRVIADMTGDKEFIDAVDSAISRLSAGRGDATTAEDLVAQAVTEVIEKGARELISLAQVRVELALIPEARILEPAHQVPSDLAALQDHNALGRMLRTLGIRLPKEGPRVRLSGQLMRCYHLDPEIVQAVLAKATEEKRAVLAPYKGVDRKRLGVSFCDNTTCTRCPYASICESVLPGVRQGKPAPNQRIKRPPLPEATE
ncbi:hypothetical protein [Sulfitobacter sp. 1A13730]|uniref:hypothetical protein n=1 Tax=Sulfitobacter sp. 1A13730 TaxID=3368569 RepID=UPI003746A8D8